MNADKKSKKKAKNLAKNALNLSTNSKDKSKKSAQKSAKNLTQNSNENPLNLKSNSSKNSLNSKLNSSKNSPTNKKTFWPYGILLSLFAIVGACIATIIYASNYPVYEDDSFLSKYQEVDYNFNEIKLKDENFKNSYQVSLNLKPQIDKKKREFFEVKPAQVLVCMRASKQQSSIYIACFLA